MISARDLAFVGCRLLSLYVLYTLLQSLPLSLHSVWGYFGDAARPDTLELFYPGRPLLPVIALLTGLALCLILWSGAGRIAAMVAAGTSATPAETRGGWSRQSILSLAFVVLGSWIVIHHLPGFVYYLFLNFQNDPIQGGKGPPVVDTAFIASEAAKTGLGLLCILGAKGLATFIARLRRWQG